RLGRGARGASWLAAARPRDALGPCPYHHGHPGPGWDPGETDERDPRSSALAGHPRRPPRRRALRAGGLWLPRIPPDDGCRGQPDTARRRRCHGGAPADRPADDHGAAVDAAADRLGPANDCTTDGTCFEPRADEDAQADLPYLHGQGW